MLAVVVFCLIAVIPVRNLLRAYVDGGASNLATLGLSTLAIMGIWIWLMTLPRIPRTLRMGVGAFPFVAILLWFSQNRFDGFSGDLIPQFQNRYTDPAERLITTNDQPVEPNAIRDGDQETISTSMASTTFPQYLGANRNGIVEGIRLDGDWKSNPPRIQWRIPMNAGWSGFAISGDQCITLEQIDENEAITCYSVATGRPIWKNEYLAKHSNPVGGVGPRSTPTISNGFVYTQGATGIVSCVRLDTGEVEWRKSILDIAGTDQSTAELAVFWGRAGSVLLHQNLAIVPFGLPKADLPGSESGGESDTSLKLLIAFNRDTGEPAWIGGQGVVSYASPIIGTLRGVEQIISVNESTATGNSLEDGHQLWTFDWPGSSSGAATNAQPILLDDHRIWISKGYGAGAAVFEISQAEAAKNSNAVFTARLAIENTTVMRSKFSNPIQVGEYVYGLSEGILQCVRIRDLKSMWKRGRYGHGQMLQVGDFFLLSAESGELVLIAVNPEKFIEVGSIDVLQGTTWNPLAISGSNVLMRNADEAACVQIPLVD
jgi:outer membrane protein assembly factor BamB